jgi:hypothetical protein
VYSGHEFGLCLAKQHCIKIRVSNVGEFDLPFLISLPQPIDLAFAEWTVSIEEHLDLPISEPRFGRWSNGLLRRCDLRARHGLVFRIRLAVGIGVKPIGAGCRPRTRCPLAKN